MNVYTNESLIFVRVACFDKKYMFYSTAQSFNEKQQLYPVTHLALDLQEIKEPRHFYIQIHNIDAYLVFVKKYFAADTKYNPLVSVMSTDITSKFFTLPRCTPVTPLAEKYGSTISYLFYRQFRFIWTPKVFQWFRNIMCHCSIRVFACDQFRLHHR